MYKLTELCAQKQYETKQTTTTTKTGTSREQKLHHAKVFSGGIHFPGSWEQCTYRFISSLEFFHNKPKVSGSDLVISHTLTQASVVILVQTTVKNHLKFTC